MDAPPSGITVGEDEVARCWWAAGDPLLRHDHDVEWGRPVSDDDRLFEMLTLEAFQSGLSWLTILRKREGFRKAFRSFHIGAVARFDSRSVDRLLGDPRIVRNRAKIEATIGNARRCADLVDEFGGFGPYVWRFEPRARPAPSDWKALVALGELPQATAMSQDLKRREWSFVGPTTVHSFMEAVGMVNHHVARCHVRDEVERERAGFRRPLAR